MKSLLAWSAAIPLFITDISINFINLLPFIIKISNGKKLPAPVDVNNKKGWKQEQQGQYPIRWIGGNKNKIISRVFTSRNVQDPTRLLH